MASTPAAARKTVLVVGDPQITAPPGRSRGAMLRAYDLLQDGDHDGL